MQQILTINGGSSTIRFALYEAASMNRRLLGKVERIGVSGTSLEIAEAEGTPGSSHPVAGATFRVAVDSLVGWLETQPFFDRLGAVGHRVVHGMQHSEPEVVTSKLLSELKSMIAYDPDHLPGEIQLIEAFLKRQPQVSQVACFDTAFHRTMPRVAKLLPLPRRYDAKGVQRYGFHGLSYSYLMEELSRLEDPVARKGALILAHLGNGASMAAIKDGKSIDTSMSFTPTAGLVMSSRTGDLDPGMVTYLARTEQMTVPHFQRMINQESGLLGVSETSSDMRDLLGAESTDERAAEAVELFVYSAKKWIGSFAAALGGLDAVVFTGGIGENSPVVRKRICDGLDFLGLKLDASLNAKNAPVISRKTASVRVRVITADEEVMIARSVSRIMAQQARKSSEL